MSARDNILNRIRKVAIEGTELPLQPIEATSFKDKAAYFAYMVGAVGGEVVDMKGSLKEALAAITDNELVSTIEELQGEALNPDSVADIHALGGRYTAVVCGKIGVAENGAVWVPIEGRRRAHLFACEHLVILLSKECIVDTMHNAMSQISLGNINYGVFISGPSKTADIEQALVMGAHGAMRLTVLIYKP